MVVKKVFFCSLQGNFLLKFFFKYCSLSFSMRSSFGDVYTIVHSLLSLQIKPIVHSLLSPLKPDEPGQISLVSCG